MRDIKFIITFVFASLLVLFSCENISVNTSKENNTKKIEVTLDSNWVSFSRDIQPLFDEDCSECHDYLNKSNSYKMLTTKQSSCKETPNYIDTINPTSSYLYVKLHDISPNGAKMKGSHWTPDKVEKLLVWIEQGAKNN